MNVQLGYILKKFGKVFVLLVFVSSCDNNLQVLDEETGLYSMYGNLDLDEQVNYIRVRDLNTPFTKEATEVIDGEVIFENLETGATEILQSERVEYQDMYLHNFVVNGAIAPDTEYRVTVHRSDGASVSETFLTPTKPAPVVTPQNDKCDVPITLTLNPLNGSTVILQYGINSETWTFPFVFGPEQYSASNSLEMEVIPINIAQLAASSGGTCSQLLSSNTLYIRIAHYAPGFYEKSTDELDQPYDILESTRLMGASYEDTLAIPIDTSSE